VPREEDLRRFPALPRATKKYERVYKGRTAVERVNARLKVFWDVDDGNVATDCLLRSTALPSHVGDTEAIPSRCEHPEQRPVPVQLAFIDHRERS
jgi:hypothetical protein